MLEGSLKAILPFDFVFFGYEDKSNVNVFRLVCRIFKFKNLLKI